MFLLKRFYAQKKPYAQLLQFKFFSSLDSFPVNTNKTLILIKPTTIKKLKIKNLYKLRYNRLWFFYFNKKRRYNYLNYIYFQFKYTLAFENDFFKYSLRFYNLLTLYTLNRLKKNIMSYYLNNNSMQIFKSKVIPTYALWNIGKNIGTVLNKKATLHKRVLKQYYANWLPHRRLCDRKYRKKLFRLNFKINKVNKYKTPRLPSMEWTKHTHLNLINAKYKYIFNIKPFIYIQKQNKIFYNWLDLAVYGRYFMWRKFYKVFYYYYNFQDYRRLHKNQLTEQQLFRWIYRLKYKQLVNQFKKAVFKTKRVFERMFLNYFELRIDTVLYRLNYAFSIKQARQWVKKSFFKVNNKIINWFRYHISIGDIIVPINNFITSDWYGKKTFFFNWSYSLMNLRLFYKYVAVDQYPDHFMYNDRIPAAILFTLPNVETIRYFKIWCVQFITLSLNKYS